MPASLEDNIPDVLSDATVGLLWLQVPPVTDGWKAAVSAGQIVARPETVPVAGTVVT